MSKPLRTMRGLGCVISPWAIHQNPYKANARSVAKIRTTPSSLTLSLIQRLRNLSCSSPTYNPKNSSSGTFSRERWPFSILLLAMSESRTTQSATAPEVSLPGQKSSQLEEISNIGTSTPLKNKLSSYQTKENREILDAIDKVREFDINHDLHIPQIVVCGDQSAGKSSVLEAITHIKFPRGSNTCTRYVTE